MMSKVLVCVCHIKCNIKYNNIISTVYIAELTHRFFVGAKCQNWHIANWIGTWQFFFNLIDIAAVHPRCLPSVPLNSDSV